RHYPRRPVKVLLTNDDGIGASGLQTLRRALLDTPGIELAVVAPNSNRSATAPSITTRSPLGGDEVECEDGTTGFATEGKPVDCSQAAAFTARMVEELEHVEIPVGTLLNVNCPAGDIAGVRVARAGKREYRDKMELVEEHDGRKRYRIYGDTPGYVEEDGTDF